MEFITLPPEITSALIHSGPGAESLIAASDAWEQLATELEESARLYSPVLATLAEGWSGPSAAVMTDAVAPYLAWLQTTAQQCQQLSASAQAATAAFASTLATVVPPSLVTANRTQLAQLLATNQFGKNLPAIAQTEEQYENMWVTNSAAMSRYQTATQQALALPPFTSPPAITDPAGTNRQAAAVSAAAAPVASAAAAAAPADAVSPLDSLFQAFGVDFNPNSGWFGLANTYANQFLSSGFPINLLSYLAQNTSAQALQSVAPEIGQGLSDGEAALGDTVASLSRAVGAAEPTAALGVGVSMGNLTAPPAVVGLLPAAQTPVQLASAATPLAAADAGFPMLPPLMPPPISAGSGWRKRKQQKYEDLAMGMELKGTFMPRPPSAG
ncbi:PPE family protein [Mycobacterium kubicae]|uniref:PPE family protein n=1 Tax=Mycobacterium kubicae TaxID=120959 RepID=UPI0018611A6D|nr:PPE family protein [Mycobacterium kubicae]QNI05895.1 PPE family protein [Mycobacterium kubicae]